MRRQRGRRVPGLLASQPCPHGPDQAAGALLTASLQGLGRTGGCVRLVSEHPQQLKLFMV